MLDLLDDNLGPEFDLNTPLLTGIITSCIKMKLAVAAKDPHERNLRRVLNLGHTLGHAVEKLTNFAVSHGEAVAIGLVFALKLSVEKGRIPASELERAEKLVAKIGLPTVIPKTVPKEALLDVMKHDKKRQGSFIRFVLPNKQAGLVDFDSQLSYDELSQYL